MSKQKLHIISFAVPDPPDYGGVIDVFYKIKALADQNVGVILHCYQYNSETVSNKLSALCEEVHYYPRQMSWRKAISTTPYIMSSRKDDRLLHRLKQDEFPILFEGMHTTAIVDHLVGDNRKLALRMHNIEWDYYKSLAQQESNWFKRIYYYLESVKLVNSNHLLTKMDVIFTISQKEQEELSKRYSKCEYLPVFHANENITGQQGRGQYILYHGNLTVAENKKAVNFIVSELYQKLGLDIPIIIAGKFNEQDADAIDTIQHVTFKPNPSKEEMDDLIRNAQIHLLPTFQSTGIKLKLINALFKGRHCIVNSTMVEGTGLDHLCHVTDTPQEMLDQIKKIWSKDFGEAEIKARTAYMDQHFSNKKGAIQLIESLNSLP
ncbi:MAG: glycosyltransferase [Bacteroidetes bacterium]|nr:glycosyltransferase [Bacteroidota bacterium]